ncbi:DUF1120 domain-containing protein [Dryocola clanedunensis]|uniref:DUF1120 domain-containing protein n=1 Tax=Cedecea sulfonylureivorans TaxID=3051154 RepID=UPI001928921C|nr:DUF1120 domain-containing protein [Cedecea sulfonylureivorans]
MFKKMQKTVCALAVLAATATSVMAAESVDVKVTGTITPSACTPTLSGGGTVDYGTIKSTSLSADSYTVLAMKSLDFGVSCDAPVKISLKAVNNRQNTTAGAEEAAGGAANSPVAIMGRSTFPVVGLGMEDDHKIGGYAMTIGSSVADGNNVTPIYQIEGSDSWANNSYETLYNAAAPILYSWSNATENVPVAVKDLTGKLYVQAYLNKSSELDLTKEITLDGMSTIEIVYL